MIQRLKDSLNSVVEMVSRQMKDAAVHRGLCVVMAALLMKHFMLDQDKADTLVTAFWSATSIILSKAPGSK